MRTLTAIGPRPRLAIMLFLTAMATACHKGETNTMKDDHTSAHHAARHHTQADTPHERGHHHHVKHTPEEWAKRLDNKERDEWQKPNALMNIIKIAPGETVAEIGAGTGYFLEYLSKAVGATGRVLVQDVEADLVGYMQQRAEKEGLENVRPGLSPFDDPALPERSVDKILLVNTWHHISKRVRYAGKLEKVLKDGGEIYVVDFNKEASVGPPPEEKLTPEQVIDELEKAGLKTEKLDENLPEQYIIRAVSK